MEILKRLFPIVALASLVPFVMANKSCEEGTTWEHPEVTRNSDCNECHEEGTMSVTTAPKSHDLAWKRAHGDLMKRFKLDTKNNCMVCHNQSTCNNCHLQEQPANHNNFFRMRGHGLMIGLDRDRCMTCHRVDFCQRCHMETKPIDHTAGFGSGQNRHCIGCHFPLSSAGAQRCSVCHLSTRSHDSAPRQPANSYHMPGANCRGAGCHTPLAHIDNGMACVACHPR
jgi:hypothetical protein